MIEEKIDALIKALHTNTEALTLLAQGPKASTAASEPAKAKGKTKAETPSPTAEPAGPTADDNRKLAQDLLDYDGANGGDKGMAFLQALKKELGCRVGDAPADKLAEVNAKLKKQLEALNAV